jgi:26S proteasome regulatory subunit N1
MGEGNSPATTTAEGESAGAEAVEEKVKSLRHQGVATIGIALVAMGEEVGAEMALRQFQHLVRASHRWRFRTGYVVLTEAR